MKRKKSKFQQRLEEIQEQHRQAQGGKVYRHNQKTPDPETPTTVSAQPVPLPDDREWISLEDERPPYYSPIDIWDGKELYEDWARVSDGEHDYYVNNRDNRVKHLVTHWSKRAGVNYPNYKPLTEDDIPIYTQRDIDGIIIQLNAMLHRSLEGKGSLEYSNAIEEALTVISYHTKEARITRGLTFSK